eukprot:242271_1
MGNKSVVWILVILLSYFSVSDAGCGLNIACHIKNAVNAATAPLTSQISSLTGIKFDLCDNFKDTLGTLSTSLGSELTIIDDYVDDIPTATAILETFTKFPLSIGPTTSDIDSLATTLSTCINSVIDAFGATGLDQVLGISNSLPVDLNEIAFKFIAVTLLPMKDQVEFVCDDGLQEILSFVNSWKNSENTRRRRMAHKRRLYENPECPREGDMCTPHNFLYPYQIPGNRGPRVKTAYQKMVDDFPDLLQHKNDYTDANKHQLYRGLLFGTQMLASGLSEACLSFALCVSSWKPTDCAPHIICGLIKYIFKDIMLQIFKYVVDSGTYHNLRINGVRIKAIFIDGRSVIHNQFKIKTWHTSKMNAQSNLMTQRFDTLAHNMKQNISTSRDNVQNEIDLQTTMITRRFDTLADNLKKNVTESIKDIRNNITHRLDKEFNASTTNINDRFDTQLFTLQSGVISITTSDENGQHTNGYNLVNIKNAIDDLQEALDLQYGTSAKTEGIHKSNPSRSPYAESNVLTITPYHLCIVGLSFVVLMTVVMGIMNILFLRYYAGYESGTRFVPVPKYDYSTSDVEDANK